MMVSHHFGNLKIHGKSGCVEQVTFTVAFPLRRGGSARRHYCYRGRRGSSRVNIGPQQQESGLQSLLQVWTRPPNSQSDQVDTANQFCPPTATTVFGWRAACLASTQRAFLVGRVSRRANGRFWIAEERAHLNFRLGRRSIEKRSYCFNPSAHGSFEGELFLQEGW
jgi:hypothetical protein